MRVMVVDDEPSILKFFKTAVEPLGFEVTALTNGHDAMRLLAGDKFDAIFVDVRMPEMDGFELTRLIRNSAGNSTVPIVMLSGLGDVDTMRKGFQAGITFFVGKPIGQERLTGILRMMRGAMLKENRRYARLPLRITVTWEFGGNRFTAESLNISEGGMLLESSGGATLGQVINLRFLLPGVPDILSVRGRVVRKAQGDQMAIQFIDLVRETREAIQTYISGKIHG